MSLDPVRIAVVGYGYWGPNLVRNLSELPAAELRWLCDTQQDARERAMARYPHLRTSSELDDVLSDPAVDALVVVNAGLDALRHRQGGARRGKTRLRREAARCLDKRGARTGDARDGRRPRADAGAHVPVQPARQHDSRSRSDAGELGEIYSISMSRVNLGLHQPDASVAWDLGPHDFSILRYWLGEVPSHVAALSRGCILPDTADVAFINLEHSSGTIAHVELSWLAPSKLRRTTIIGSQKMIVYDDTSTEPVRIFDSGVMIKDPESFGEFKLSYRTGDILSPRVEAAEPLQLEMKDFCHAIRSGSPPRSSWRVGLDVVRVVEAVDQSLALNGARVAVKADDLVGDLLPSGNLL